MAPMQCLSFFLIVCFSFSRFTNAISNHEIHRICNKIPDREFCLRVFGQDKNVRAAPDLRAGEIQTLSLALNYIDATVKYTIAVQARITDPIGRSRINTCLDDYRWTNRHFQNAWDWVNKKNPDFEGMMQSISKADYFMSECDRVYKTNPVTVSPIADFTKDVATLKEIIRVVYDLIKGQYHR